jgi:hypothetical protein
MDESTVGDALISVLNDQSNHLKYFMENIQLYNNIGHTHWSWKEVYSFIIEWI